MTMTNDKRGVFLPVLMILGVLSVFYLIIIWNPAHIFDAVKSTINYFIAVFIFLLIQVGIVFLYYQLGKYVTKGFRWYHFKLKRITENVHRKIEMSQFR